MPVRLWLLPAPAALSACSEGQTDSQKRNPAPQLTFHEAMKDGVDKRADELWDLSNKSIGDRAGVDPAKMTDANWAERADKADAVQKAALAIVSMNPIVVVKPGVKIGDEGGPGGHTGAQVQRQVDKDPQKLRDMANVLAVHMSDLAKGARAHDATKVGPRIDQLDGVCEDCHLEFWYPDQKELINKFRKATS